MPPRVAGRCTGYSVRPLGDAVGYFDDSKCVERLLRTVLTMAPPSRRAGTITSREVRALLRKADRLFAEGARLQSLAKRALIEHFRHESDDEPIAEDRARRARMSRSKPRKKGAKKKRAR